MRSVAEIEAELKAAKLAESQERKAKLESVVPIWEHTVEPSKPGGFQELYDPACVWYKIKGTCLNYDEAVAAGHNPEHLRDGGMDYIFNTLSGQIVCDSGGGRVFIGFNSSKDPAHYRAIQQVSEFIVANPLGGNVDDIIAEFTANKKDRWS